ncbi:MAG: BMC domain-containing protein [Firmicutes bacterium]|nr:BMC domain-containing protein [Bacillota bacterium]
MNNAIGLVECISIGRGYEAADAMVKRAGVTLLACRTVCSGKHITMVGGDVAAVNASVEAGLKTAEGSVIDHFVIPNIHESIIPAILGASPVDISTGQVSLGIIETFTVASLILSADAAVKAANVVPVEVRVAIGIGGKSHVTLVGEVSAVKSAVEAGASLAAQNGLLISKVVIPSLSADVLRAIL